MLEYGSSSDEEDKSSCDELDMDLLNRDDLKAELNADKNLSEDELFEKEFQLHKRNYYINKLKYPEVTK